MSRLAIPAVQEVPEASKPVLDAVQKQLGSVPNMFRLIAQSPAALQGYVANNSALGKALDVKTRERIALAVAQVNGCDAENVFTNLLNVVADTDIDFPVVHARDAA